MKRKVLVFGMTENPGGIESVIMNYYRNISRDLVQFDFLCNCKKIAYEEEIRSLGGEIFNVTARKENPLKFHRQVNEFMKLHAVEYDAMWVNVCSLVNIDYLIFAKKYGIPRIIIHCHNSDNDGSQMKKLVHLYNKMRIEKYATDFWSCSDSASPWFFTQKIIHSDKYKVIPNAIDVDQYKRNDEIRAAMRKKYQVEDKIVIGHVGRFHFQKNHSFLIDIFEQLANQNEKYRLLLIGQGVLENDIKKLVEKKELEQKVNEETWMTGQEIADVFDVKIEETNQAAAYAGSSMFFSYRNLPESVAISQQKETCENMTRDEITKMISDGVREGIKLEREKNDLLRSLDQYGERKLHG